MSEAGLKEFPAQDFTGFNAFGNTQMYLTPFMYDPSAPHGEEKMKTWKTVEIF